ncbi:3'-5' exonuclease, PolB-like protein [Thioalkalivibrio sp. K90mix]|uniref:3'-5' exonuclease n=1 Tax=Thioalkalivibrio sp. (strain K90mix) TaxID=396595 RepID=UPI000195A5A3|nr:3'-5' exonuclease [Thioalkalivibrio sp. K90mix]ADC71104.1 3'-5' exonuclease, PolB-like protein [Thioalkalivibrio sp. K90mix]
MSAPILIFDLETVPDIDGARRLHDFEGLSDHEVAEALFALRRAQAGTEFLKHPLHRIVSIGVLYQGGDALKLSAFGREGEDSPAPTEAELLRQFFDVIDKRTPQLVSWNGGGFDLPVLHYRALVNGVQAPRYWEQGDDDREFRYNNYLSRFHWRHVDLMDVLAGFQGRAVTSLDMMASLLGFPGKLGMDGSKVWPAWRDGRQAEIHDYVEHDVLNTYLVWLRFEYMRGNLTDAALASRQQQLAEYLKASGAAHHREFLDAWQAAGRTG